MKTIEPQETAVNEILNVTRYSRGGSLRLIGDPGDYTVPLEQPAVVDPEKDNDAHWMAIKAGGTPFVLDKDNTWRGVPFTGGPLRVRKPLSTGKSFGVEYV